MSWVSLTFNALQTRLTSTELEALLAESPNPEAKVSEVLEQVAQDIVSRVNAGRRKRGLAGVSITGAFVPPGAQRHAYSLARRALSDSFPSLAEFNGDDRKLSIDAAEDYLDDLANNNADSDDTGATAYAPSSSSFRYGGAPIMDFSTQP